MNPRRLLNNKTLPFRYHQFRPTLAPWAGISTSGLVIAIGKTLTDTASTKLSAWTSLVFLAIFSGLLIYSLIDKRLFTARWQKISITMGCGFSALSLGFIEHAIEGVSEFFLFGATFLLVTTVIVSFKGRSAPRYRNQNSLDNDLIHRLDAIQKYNLCKNSRLLLTDLIDAIWQAPPNTDSFIPAQNQKLETLIKSLENMVFQQLGSESVDRVLIDAHQCLKERNSLLLKNVTITYRSIGESVAHTNELNRLK